MIGVTTGFAPSSNVGAGYALGAAVSWEVRRTLEVRLKLSGGATTGGLARITFLNRGEWVFSEQRADWLSTELGLGAAWLFRDVARLWAPYVGADVGIAFSGYEYHFDETVADLASEIDLATRFEEGGQFGITFGPTATLRAGVRVELIQWMATLGEISLTWAQMKDDEISNTLPGPQVHSVAENVWLLRATFSVRFGL